MEAVLEYLADLWWAITQALVFNPKVFQVVQSEPDAFYVMLGVAILGGASLLLGQSVILFANRVKPIPFLLSLLLNGVLYLLGLSIWAFAFWLVGNWWFEVTIPLERAMRIILLTAAPAVFAFLGLIPYLGMPILRVLSVWSILVAVQVVRAEYQANVLEGFLVVGLGWGLILAVGHTLGWPLSKLRNRLWRTFIGVAPTDSVREVLERYLQKASHKP